MTENKKVYMNLIECVRDTAKISDSKILEMLETMECSNAISAIEEFSEFLQELHVHRPDFYRIFTGAIDCASGLSRITITPEQSKTTFSLTLLEFGNPNKQQALN